jgi:hypothetical protein
VTRPILEDPKPILDFEKARSSAAIGPHGEIDPRIEEASLELQAQAAVAAEREKYEAGIAAKDAYILSLRDHFVKELDKLAPLVKAHRDWVEAKKGWERTYTERIGFPERAQLRERLDNAEEAVWSVDLSALAAVERNT